MSADRSTAWPARRSSSSRPCIEDLELKRAVFAALDAAAYAGRDPGHEHERAVRRGDRLGDDRPERVVGLHFFNPAPLMPLVEVVAGRDAVATVVDASRGARPGWGKTPVRSADTPGLHRQPGEPTVHARGAARCSKRAPARSKSIDAAVRAAGFPMGPFELMDLIGIDVNLAAARGIYEAFRYEPRLPSVGIQERLVEAGRLGRKTREGFYWYADDGRRLGVAGAFAVEPEPAAIPAAQRLPSGAGLAAGSPADDGAPRADRLLNGSSWRSSTRPSAPLGDGVAGRDDIDLALRLGAAHPSGPFERGRAFGGPAAVLARMELWRAAGPRFDPAPALSDAAAHATDATAEGRGSRARARRRGPGRGRPHLPAADSTDLLIMTADPAPPTQFGGIVQETP